MRKKLSKISFVFIVLVFTSSASTNNQEKLKPIEPRSIIKPSVGAYYNRNIDLNTIKSIAIVRIVKSFFPSLEEGDLEFKSLIAKQNIDLEIQENALITELELYVLDGTISEEKKEIYIDRLNNLKNIKEKFDDRLATASEETLVRQVENFNEITDNLIYNNYNDIFLAIGFDVIERKRIDLVLNELALSMTGLIDESTAIEIGQLVSADAICIIEILHVDGERFNPPDVTMSHSRESFKVIKTETGQIIFSGNSRNAIEGQQKMFQMLVKKILNDK